MGIYYTEDFLGYPNLKQLISKIVKKERKTKGVLLMKTIEYLRLKFSVGYWLFRSKWKAYLFLLSRVKNL
jgi:hypothetical protein